MLAQTSIRVSCAVALLMAVSSHATEQSVETIATGLNNPRGIAFASHNGLYVVEAGSGGEGQCIASPVPPFPLRCYGETGAVTRIAPHGVPGFKRVVTGLPSLGLASGQAEGGPADISFHGAVAYVTVGWGGDPRQRAALGEQGSLFGSLLRVKPNGRYAVLADVAGHEVGANPYGGAIDSNPFGLLALPGRRIVADAGANALVEVLANRATRTFSVLSPANPGARDPVPTSVVEGPDGALYVGQLTGFPFFKGTSSVLRISSDGSSTEVYASGFTAVVDIAIDATGALYVLEIASGQQGPFPPPAPGLGNGRLVRQCSDGASEVLLDDLVYPGGVAIGPDDAIYLTNYGISPDTGEVLKVTTAPCACMSNSAPHKRATRRHLGAVPASNRH